jgi:hypothetical protein
VLPGKNVWNAGVRKRHERERERERERWGDEGNKSKPRPCLSFLPKHCPGSVLPTLRSAPALRRLGRGCLSAQPGGLDECMPPGVIRRWWAPSRPPPRHELPRTDPVWPTVAVHHAWVFAFLQVPLLRLTSPPPLTSPPGMLISLLGRAALALGGRGPLNSLACPAVARLVASSAASVSAGLAGGLGSPATWEAPWHQLLRVRAVPMRKSTPCPNRLRRTPWSGRPGRHGYRSSG